MYRIFFILILGFVFLIDFLPEDKAWVACSNEKDLYRYVYQGWKVDKVLKKGDITLTDTGRKLYYVGEDPEIYLSKDNKIKILNFGWRCWHEMGPELNYEKNNNKIVKNQN